MSSAAGILSTGLCLYKNAERNNTSISALKNEIHVQAHKTWFNTSQRIISITKKKPYNTLSPRSRMLLRELNVHPVVQQFLAVCVAQAFIFMFATVRNLLSFGRWIAFTFPHYFSLTFFSILSFGLHLYLQSSLLPPIVLTKILHGLPFSFMRVTPLLPRRFGTYVCTGYSKMMEGIWKRYNLKSIRRIYTLNLRTRNCK